MKRNYISFSDNAEKTRCRLDMIFSSLYILLGFRDIIQALSTRYGGIYNEI